MRADSSTHPPLPLGLAYTAAMRDGDMDARDSLGSAIGNLCTTYMEAFGTLPK